MKILTQKLISYITEKNPLQKKYLENSIEALSLQEKEGFENLLFILQQNGNSITLQAEGYLTMVQDVLVQSKFFMENHRYRYNKLSEVEDRVYNNRDYMNKYMLGLTLSNYLWTNHRKMLAWFEALILKTSGKSYLEIGPGYGQYFLKAIQNESLNEFSVVDLSETSLNGFKSILKYYNADIECNIYHENFLCFNHDQKYDIVVAGEVLEHVEEPELFIKKIHGLTHKESRIFLTTAINAPAIDHIYLFDSIDAVTSLTTLCGFEVLDMCCVSGNGKSLEIAQKKKTAINISLLLQQKQ